MKKSKIIILIVFLLVLAGLSSLGLLYFSSTLLIKYLHLDGFEPSLTLPFDLVHVDVKKIQGFAKVAIGASFALPLLAFGGVGLAILLPKKRGLHGDARFATKMEIVKAGLLAPDTPKDKYPSVIVGKIAEEFLLFKGQQFLYLAAPTRSGKGVGVVIPNCLHYRDSLVNLDIKGENYQMTSGFRAKCGQKIYKFAPDDENGMTDCWNPLTYVREDKFLRVSDLMSITNILYPPSDDVWSSTAENLFLGIALYIMDTPLEMDSGKFNISTIKKYSTSLEFLKDEESLMKYVKERERFGVPLDDSTIEHLQKYAQTSDKVRNSISISFDAPLAVFSDPITALATSKSTFDFRDLRKQRMSIYVVIKPSTIDKFGKFLNLFFQQLLVQNMAELPEENPALKYQCLLLLDEFPAMGRVAMIEKGSAYMAGYNMRLLLIFQSKSQIQDKKLYDVTGAKTMLTNMALQIIYAPRDDDDAKDYSTLIGDMTEKGISTSRQTSGNSGSSESKSDQRRAVLLPQEIKAIGMEKAIISMENMMPALVDKVFWYKEPIFIERRKYEAPSPPCQLPQNNVIEELVTMDDTFGGKIEGLQNIPSGAMFETGFSPRRNAKEVVISAILSAKEELLIAAYSFTCPDIAKAIVERHKNGVKVFVVVDKEQNSASQGGFNACMYLEGEKVPIKYSICYKAMHHKFLVIDRMSVQLGSFNYTHSANMSNAETAIFLMNVPQIADQYRREFLQIYREEQVPYEELMKKRIELEVIKKTMEAA